MDESGSTVNRSGRCDVVRGMRPRKPLIAAAVAAALTMFWLVGLGTSKASAAQPDHLVVLAGSPHFVAYADFPVPHAGKPDYAHGELHVFSDKGRDRDLGPGFGNVDPATPAPYRFSLVDTSLTGYSSADPTHVKWWDLASNTKGVATLPSGASWQGSAPGGWVIVAADHETVAVETSDGTTTSYGTPIPAEAAALGSIATHSGPSGFVAFGATTGSAMYERWDSIGQTTSLDLGSSAGSSTLSCNNVTGALVGCVDVPAAGGRAVHLAVPLDGSAPRSYPGCSVPSVAVQSKLAWVCPAPHATPRFAAGSHVRKSSVLTTDATGVSGLGGFVTLGPRQRALIAVRNSHSVVDVLVAIPSLIIKLDDGDLRAAANDLAALAVSSGALETAPSDKFPAQVIQTSTVALLRAALARDPSRQPRRTTSIMGRVPHNLRHHVWHRLGHRHITRTRALRPFRHAVPDPGSPGIGVHAVHGGSTAAPFRAPDGVYVQPKLAAISEPTIGMVALRTALGRIGQPYVWAGGGPITFDCSGLTQWAYAHAGIHLVHYTGSQWNQGRLIKPRQILPGDLILFSSWSGGRQLIHHVGMYLGAGWMVNAPYTGQYVNVVKVPSGIAGVVRP